MTTLAPFTPRQDPPIPYTAIEYPESDGQPMAESDHQLIWLVYLLDAMRTHFAAAEDVYVGANMLMYYEEGNPTAAVAPDVFFVRGIGKYPRDTYKVWVEGKAPDLVVEILSKSSVYNDKAMKRGLYAELGVQEYILFDPKFQYLTPAMQGYSLVDDYYQPLPTQKLIDGTLVLSSQVSGLQFRLQNRILRLYDPLTGETLLPHEETERQRRMAEARAAYEAEARQEAEARIAELEAQLRQLRQGK
jgi:Uma2 family endonuclease